VSGFVRDVVCSLPANADPRVCIIAAFNETYRPLADIARPNWRAYCLARGYACRWYPNGFMLDPERPEVWGDKGRFSCYYDVRGLCDIVVYCDIDALFTNFAERVEDRILRDRFWYTFDQGGPCSGLWIARTDDKTERHLRYAYEYAASHNNVRHGKIEPNGISDQDAFRELMHVPPFSQTFGPWNCHEAADAGHCYPESWTPESWLITFPGVPLDQKIRLMNEYAARLVVKGGDRDLLR
jgi:hypothetical protein